MTWFRTRIKYRGHYVCSECKGFLTTHDVTNSRGVCPHCGYSSNSTVCSVESNVVTIREYYFLGIRYRQEYIQ